MRVTFGVREGRYFSVNKARATAGLGFNRFTAELV